MVEQREALEKSRKRNRQRRRIIIFSLAGALALFILFYSLISFTNVFLGSVENTESSPTAAGDWSMFRRDLLHSGTTGNNAVLPEGKIKWTFETGNGIHSSAAVVDGVVYFGSRDHKFYALEAATGALKWAFQGGSWFESSPAVVGGVVYVGCNDGKLYAIDAATGNKIWEFQMRYATRSSPAVADGMVYIGNDDGYLYAVDAASGKLIWRGDTGKEVSSSPAVSRGVVIVGSNDGLCYSFNAKNGRSMLEFRTVSFFYASPAIKDGIAYIADASGFFYALDISKRNWLWENKVRHYWNVLYVYGVAPRPSTVSGYVWSTYLGFGIRSTTSATIVENNAYLGAGNSVVAIDLTEQKTAWTFNTGDKVLSTPVVVGNMLFVGASDGHLYALDKSTGQKLWDIATGDEITASPAVADGVIYIGSEDGIFYAIE